MRSPSSISFLAGLLLVFQLSHGASDTSLLEAQLDDPAEHIRSNAMSALLAQGEEGRGILRKRADLGEGRASLEAITALRGDPLLIAEEKLERLMDRWITKSAPLLSPPFPDTASRIKNGGFEEDGGWELHTEDGAVASYTVSDSLSRSGGRSLCISRKNAAGTTFLRSEPITVPAGESPTARGFFHSKNAAFVSTLRMRFEDEAGNVLAGDEMHGHLRQSQTLLQNSPAGQWIKRVAVLPSTPHQRTIRLRLYFDGNPGDVWLDDFTFPSQPFSYQHTAPIRPLQTPLASPPQSSQRGKPTTSSAIRHDDATEVRRNGKPCAPVMYHNMQSTFADFAQMSGRAGLNWQVVMVPFRNPAMFKEKYPPGFEYWRTDGSFDIEGGLKMISDAAVRMGEPSAIILGLSIGWPASWGEEHPDRRWKSEDGSYAAGTEGHMLGFTKQLPIGQQWWLSPFDEASLQAAIDGVRQLVRAGRTQPWFARIAGCFIAGGHDGQFFTAAWPDYSEPAVLAFRAWLKEKYKTEAALHTAWRQPDVTFKDVAIPPIAAAAKRAGGFFDPARDQAVVDYMTCLSERGMRIREAIAAAFKEEVGKPVIALAWEMNGGSGSSVASIFLHSQSLDGVAPQPFYELRLPGLAGGITAPLASYNLHGKLCIKELDLRTWLRAGGGEVDNQRISAAMTPEMFRNISRKEASQMIAAHQGFWYYDIGTTHYRDPALLDEIAATREMADSTYAERNSFQPQTALIHCGQASLWEVPMAYNPVPPSLLSRFNYSAIKASGVPYDSFFLSDFMTLKNIESYRLVIFQDAWHLSAEEKQWIDENLKKDGRYLVWCYGAGYLLNEGGRSKGDSSLTGIQTFMTRSSQLRAFASGSPNAQQKLIGSTDLVLRMYEGLLPLQSIPRFVVDDPDVQVLAHYEDGKVAAASRHFETWTSVYLAMPGSLDPETINHLASDANAFRASEPGLVVEMNSNFLSVHSLQAGTFDIQLPAPSIVHELVTAPKMTDSPTGKLTITTQAGETRWYILIQP